MIVNIYDIDRELMSSVKMETLQELYASTEVVMQILANNGFEGLTRVIEIPDDENTINIFFEENT